MVTNITQLIENVENADSATKLVDAVRQLSNTISPEAIPTLIKVLGYNNPGAAVAAVDGLIAIGEAAVMPLLEQLDGYNYGARAWAVRALAGIGDPRGLNILLDAAANDFALSVRRAAASGLGGIKWEILSPTKVGENQLNCLNTLRKVIEDHEWVVRYAGIVGLQGLATNLRPINHNSLTEIVGILENIFSNDDILAVRARAMMAKEKLIGTI
jgi:phycocyanobilin lyase beta subunit